MSKSGKPRNSYSLLQRKMNEVEKKTKKPADKLLAKKNSVSKNSTKNEDSKEKEKKKTPPPPAKKPEDPNEPDRSYGDYFCNICDSHMNSDAMWEAHITGKRHIKNVKKGDTDTKYEDLNEESKVMDQIESVKDPVVGLQYIHEIRRREGIPPVYNCFLCHASIATIPLVIDHVISLKHRTNYVKENSPDAFAIIDAVNLKKGQLEPLLLEECAKLEEKFGRGKVKVKLEKPKINVPYKRRDKDDDDDVIYEGSQRASAGFRTTVKPVEFVPTPSPWKSIDIPSSASYQDDYGWRNREIDMGMNYLPRDYSPLNDRGRSRFYGETSPTRDISNRSYSRLSDDYARRSPARQIRPSPDRLARRSPDRHARRSPERGRFSRPSPDDFSRRSPNVFSRQSPEGFPRKRSPEGLPRRRSPDRLSRRSPDRLSRRSPDRFERQSPDRFARRSSSRSRSPRRYSRSPERSYSYAERSRSNYASSPPKFSESYHSEDAYRSSSTFEKTQEPKPVERPVSDVDINRRQIAEALINMPTETFFKMALLKLKGLQLRGLSELNLLVELISEAKNVLSANLNPDSQNILRERVARALVANQPSPSIPSTSSSSVHNLPSQVQPASFQNGMQLQSPLPKSAISQINDLIFGARKESDMNSRNNMQTQPANYNTVSSTGQHAAGPGAANFPPSRPAAANFPPSGPAAANFPPSGPAAANFPPPPGPSMNFPPLGPAAANFPPLGPAAANFPPPGPAAPKYPPGSTSMYNDNQQASSSAIPGLTLTEKEATSQQPRINYPASQPWPGSYRREQDYLPYNRF